MSDPFEISKLSARMWWQRTHGIASTSSLFYCDFFRFAAIVSTQCTQSKRPFHCVFAILLSCDDDWDDVCETVHRFDRRNEEDIHLPWISDFGRWLCWLRMTSTFSRYYSLVIHCIRIFRIRSLNEHAHLGLLLRLGACFPKTASRSPVNVQCETQLFPWWRQRLWKTGRLINSSLCVSRVGMAASTTSLPPYGHTKACHSLWAFWVHFVAGRERWMPSSK